MAVDTDAVTGFLLNPLLVQLNAMFFYNNQRVFVCCCRFSIILGRVLLSYSLSSSISGSVPSFPPPTYGETYKSYRPRLQKQESLPLRGMSLGAVNTSQSMPFNQPKLSNGKVEYTGTESTYDKRSLKIIRTYFSTSKSKIQKWK